MNVAEAYKFLQLDPYASVDDVSASFRRLLKEYHPDRNSDRGEWSHSMTVRLTEAYAAVTEYLRFQPEPAGPHNDPAEEQYPRDTGYSVAMQLRIADLYDALLDQVFVFYNHGMDNIYLRQEGTLRLRFRAAVRQTAEVVQALRDTKEWPGSALQYRQLAAILDFAAAFYENMLVKPKKHEVYGGTEQKAAQLYRQGSDILDQAIRDVMLNPRNPQNTQRKNGMGSPGGRQMAERTFMLILYNFPSSTYVPETLIKLYLLRAFSHLCTFLEGPEA